MDVFQGCFKDGTEPGTRDLRWFSSVFFVIRILIHIIEMHGMIFVYLSILFTILLNILVFLNPYKSKYSHYIIFDSAGLILLSLFALSIMAQEISIEKKNFNFYSII